MNIKEYEKKGKKHYKVVNLYLGLDSITNKEIRKNKAGFKTKKDAKLYIAKMQNEFQENNLIARSKEPKFEEIYNMWFDVYKKSVKDSTIISNTKILQTIVNHFKNIKIKDITTPLVQDFINGLSLNYKHNTIKRFKSVLSMIIKYAIEIRVLNYNPVIYVKIADKKEKLESNDNFYTKKELKEFLNKLENESIKTQTLFYLLAFTGARKGEILALTWQDVDFSKETITINKTLSRSNGKPIISTPKNKYSNRIISLDDFTKDVLKKYKKTTENNMLFSDKRQKFNYLSFPNEELKRIYKKYPELKRITIHGFRHTHASLLFEAGADLKDVQVRLGHNDITTTMDIYTHITKHKKEELADKFKKYMAL